MKDMMMEIYTALCADQLISENVTKDRIRFYEAPETLDVSKPFIIIDALSPQTSANFSANKVDLIQSNKPSQYFDPIK